MSKKKETITELYKLMLDYQPFETWIKDTQGKYLAFNQAFAERTGLPAEEIAGKSDLELFPKEAPYFEDSDRRTIEGSGEETTEFFYWGAWSEEFKRLVRDEQGNPVAVMGVRQDITRRRTAEEALRESEMSLSVLLSNLPGVAYRCLNNQDWAMTFLSEGCLELTGYTPEELIHGDTTYYDLILPEDRQKVFAQWEKDLDARARSNDEYRIRTRTGEIKWIWEQSVPIPEENGASLYSEGFIQDISKTKNIEKALKESERSMAVLLSNLPGVAYRSLNDDEWTMTFLSEGCLELTGYTPEELIHGKTTYYDLILPEDREHVYAQWEIDVAAGLRSNDEYRIRTRSGEIKWIWEQSIPVPAEDGPSVFSEGFIQDISKTKKAEDALKASEEQFKAIFEEAPLGIGIFSNVTGKAIKLNPKFTEIHKREMDELMNLDWVTYSHPEDILENQKLLRQMMSGESTGFSMDKRIIRGDGATIWVNMVITPYHVNSEESCHLCMMEDITFSKIKEQEIEYLSYHDSLTGLYNRRLFEEEMRRISISRKLPVSIIMGDVNGLKMINDSFGHKAGDRLLQEAAMLLRENCREEDFVARIGGDEFIIILEGADQELTEQICGRIYKAFRNYTLRPDKRTFYLSISLGHATKTIPDQTMDQLMKEADEKQYQKKHQMKKRVHQEILAAIKSELEQNRGLSLESRRELSQLVGELGTRLHLSPVRRNNLQMLLEICDIGRLTLPISLRKKPVWDMTPEEYQKYAKHAETGYRIVQGAQETKKIAGDLMAHHENWDGTGYPNGLKGREIPLLARIARAVDLYYEITRGEPPEGQADLEGVISHLESASGSLLDPEISSAFVQVLKSQYGKYLQ